MVRFRGLTARRCALLLMSIAGPLLAGCGLSRRASTPVDRSDDPRIREQVTTRIAAEPSLDASSIRVDVDAGVVMLHGSVRGIGAWQCALTTASLVPGTRTVVDYLNIERGPRDVRCVAPRPDSSVITVK